MTEDNVIIDSFKPFFPVNAHRQRKLSLGYWNIGRIGNKLENANVLQFLSNFDVIWVSELRTDMDVHLSGFKYFRNSEKYSNHCGLWLLIKNDLVEGISFILFDKDDVIWVSFTFTPNLISPAAYIFATIYSRLMDTSKPCILMCTYCYEARIYIYRPFHVT